MKPVTIGLGSEVVALTEDPTGYSARVEVDGQLCLVHLSITPTGPGVLTPAKWVHRPA